MRSRSFWIAVTIGLVCACLSPWLALKNYEREARADTFPESSGGGNWYHDSGGYWQLHVGADTGVVVYQQYYTLNPNPDSPWNLRPNGTVPSWVFRPSPDFGSEVKARRVCTQDVAFGWPIVSVDLRCAWQRANPRAFLNAPQHAWTMISLPFGPGSSWLLTDRFLANWLFFGIVAHGIALLSPRVIYLLRARWSVRTSSPIIDFRPDMATTRRTLRMVVLFVCVGTMLNFAIASMFATIGVNSRWLIISGRDITALDWPAELVDRQREFTLGRSTMWWCERYDATWSDPARLYTGRFIQTLYDCGFPARSFRASEESDYDVAPPAVAKETFPSTVRFGVIPRLVMIPLRPIWPGVALNTLFYAVLAWGVYRVPPAIRRQRWLFRARCEFCGYELAGLPPGSFCPECGRGAKFAQ